MRPGYCQEPLHSDRHHDEDAAAETESVERVVKVGKYCQQSFRVELVVIVPHDIKDSKDQVKCIKHIESDQEVVEANFLLKVYDLELGI